jgi:hypothetical protein
VRDLADFLDRQAAFITQKCIYEYARARSGLLSSKLFREPAFRQAVEEARWRNYPLSLQNVARMVEQTLRVAAKDRAFAVRLGVGEAVRDVCGRYPVPPGKAASFWDDAARNIARRIDVAALAAPRAVKDIPRETAAEFFAGLPIHPDLSSYDRELVTNNVRANLCRAYEEFIAAADEAALIAALAAAGERVQGASPA